MRLIVCDSYEEMSIRGARLVASQIILKPDSVLGLATGSTPIGLYENLIKLYNIGEINFKNITTFNLDEYFPISPSNKQSYHYYMNKYLFNHINIDKENTFILNGEAQNPDEECEKFEKLIENHGNIDLQLLGIGQNGHIGFNEPDNALNTYTHITKLTNSTIKANSRFFENAADVPKFALTMGVGTILKSKKIILLASGKNKHSVVHELLTDEINTKVPATMLKVHPDVVLICDKEAYND